MLIIPAVFLINSIDIFSANWMVNVWECQAASLDLMRLCICYFEFFCMDFLRFCFFMNFYLSLILKLRSENVCIWRWLRNFGVSIMRAGVSL